MHKDPIRFEPALRERVGLVMLLEFEKRYAELIVLAVSSDHVHGLARVEHRRVRAPVGHAKRWSSHAIRDVLPGVVWGKKCGLKTIRDRSHQIRTFRYIETHRSEGAWVWTFNDVK